MKNATNKHNMLILCIIAVQFFFASMAQASQSDTVVFNMNFMNYGGYHDAGNLTFTGTIENDGTIKFADIIAINWPTLPSLTLSSMSSFGTFDAYTNIWTNNALAWQGQSIENTLAYVSWNNTSSAWSSYNGAKATFISATFIPAVPVPAAIWLFGSGLIGLLSFNRRKNKTTNVIAA